MAVPMLSRGTDRICPALLPAVMAATAALPRLLTAACSTMEPTAVMLHCRPIGRPITHRSAQRAGLKRPSSRLQPSIRKFLAM